MCLYPWQCLEISTMIMIMMMMMMSTERDSGRRSGCGSTPGGVWRVSSGGRTVGLVTAGNTQPPPTGNHGGRHPLWQKGNSVPLSAVYLSERDREYTC